MDLGFPMKVQIQSESSTAVSLTDRLGALIHASLGYKNEFKIETSVFRMFLQRKIA